MTMSFWKKAMGGALAAAMALTIGCSTADTGWAYRSAGQQPPIGVYINYMISAASSADAKLHETESEAHEHSSYKDMLNEAVEGQTVADFMKAEAATKTKEFIAVENKFAELGLTLDESETAYAASTAASNWSGQKDFYETNGVAESSLRLIYENQFKRETLFNATYGPEGAETVSDDELKALFQKDYAKVEMMIFQKDTAEGADNTAVKTRAEGFRKRLQEGENLYDLILEQEKEDAGESADSVVRAEEGSRALILSEADKGYYYSDELVDTALASTIGAPVLAEDTNYVYLLSRTDILGNAADFETYRSEILHTLRDDAFAAAISGWVESAGIEANQAALDRYTPQRLKIDM